MITNSKTFFRIFLSLVFLIALASLTPRVVYAAHEGCPGGSTKENYCAKYVCNRCDASGQCHDGYSQVGCAGASLGSQCGQIDDIYKCNGDGSIRGHAVAINCGGDCAYNGNPNPTPTTAPRQCPTAPLLLIDKGDGSGFRWYGASTSVGIGTQVCYMTDDQNSYFQTTRQERDGNGWKGVSHNPPSVNCMVVNPADPWTTGLVEAFVNNCSSVAEATEPNSQCAQNYSSESCRNFTDIIPVAVVPTLRPPATPTPTLRPPATPTPTLRPPATLTPTPLLQCSRVAVIKNGVEVPAPYSLVKYGDRVTFRGFANVTGRTATSMTFSHTIISPGSTTGRATTARVPMTLVGNAWQADYNYLMVDGGKHVVKVVSIQ